MGGQPVAFAALAPPPIVEPALAARAAVDPDAGQYEVGCPHGQARPLVPTTYSHAFSVHGGAALTLRGGRLIPGRTASGRCRHEPPPGTGRACPGPAGAPTPYYRRCYQKQPRHLSRAGAGYPGLRLPSRTAAPLPRAPLQGRPMRQRALQNLPRPGSDLSENGAHRTGNASLVSMGQRFVTVT